MDGLIDHVADYWDERPCNIRHSPLPVGTLAYFDEVEARKYFVEPHIPGFAQFERWKGKKVLEIGCGIGTDSINFARAGADLSVVELSRRSLDICRERFAVYRLGAKFYLGNAEELSSFVPVEPYDLIYSFGVIHHSPNPGRIVEEMLKYCKPDTELRIMLYSKWSWKALWIILKYGGGAFWRARDLVRVHSEAAIGSPVTHCYSFREIRRLLVGFEVVRIWKDHIFPYEIDKYVNYEYEKMWYFRWIPAPLFETVERVAGWHTLIVARPRELFRE